MQKERYSYTNIAIWNESVAGTTGEGRHVCGDPPCEGILKCFPVVRHVQRVTGEEDPHDVIDELDNVRQ